MKRTVIRPFDRTLIKSPDQFTLRLNELVDRVNQNNTVELVDPKSQFVIVIGVQPDNTFGVAKWTKKGEAYSGKVVIS